MKLSKNYMERNIKNGRDQDKIFMENIYIKYEDQNRINT